MTYGDRRDSIACPGCGYVPFEGQQWICAPDGCGESFDTFDTRARCPHCDAQFPWTMCPSCGKTSSHGAWYQSGARPSG
jgi:hypothetical protein